MLYNSTDQDLVLVAGKAVLLKVNVTAATVVSQPGAGSVRVQNADGTSKDITLDAPRVRIPTAVPVVPSFDDAYTATLPAEVVKSGMKLTINVPGASATTLSPRVGGGVAMRFVPISVKIGSTAGQLPKDLAPHLKALLPVSSVSVQSHAAYVSGKVTSMPGNEDAWADAMDKILGELSDLHAIEGAGSRDYYVGFLPKRTWGLSGMGYMPGAAVVSFDMPSAPDKVRDTVTHELGHNFSLPHAGCGNVSEPDSKYPYPDANLGTPGHYVWPYLDYLRTFHDPRPQSEHDIMSYCGGAVFSDYNYRQMQVFLTPVDKAVSAAAKASSAEPTVSAVQEVLLVSGAVRGSTVELNPVKSLQGRPAAQVGPYTLRVTTAAGVVDSPFSVRSLDHKHDLQHFSVVIPNTGAVVGLAVLRDGQVLTQAASQATSSVQSKTSTQSAATSGAALQLSEANGALLVRWDAAGMPFMTVTWTDGSRRINLAQDLRGGSARLSTAELPSGGRFEVVLSDGLNSTRFDRSR